MIKKLTLLSLLVLIAQYSFAEYAITHSFDESLYTKSKQSNPIRTITKSDNGLEVKFTFPTVTQAMLEESSDLSLWRINGFLPENRPGFPILPVKREKFYIPEEFSVEIDFEYGDYIDFKTDVLMSPPITVDIENETALTPIVNYEGFYPDSPIIRDNDGLYRSNRIVSINVYPLQYNKEDQRLRYYQSMTYRIKYSKTVRSKISNDYSENLNSFDPVLCFCEPLLTTDSDILKLGEIEPYGSKGNDILVIYPLTLTTEAERYIRWKRRMGFNVSKFRSLNLSLSNVKNAIKNTYLKNPKLTYVLLLGDSNLIPTYEMEDGQNGYDDIFASDYDYGCMDGDDDEISDLIIGRIPIATPDEAKIVIDKILNYEFAPCEERSYYSNLVTCGYLQDKQPYDRYEDRRFIKTIEEISSYVLNTHKIIPYRCYTRDDYNTDHYSDFWADGSLIPEAMREADIWDADGGSISNVINRGAFAAIYRGHGSYDSWANVKFSSSDISRITHKYPMIYFATTCYSGAFHKNPNTGIPRESFAVKLLKADGRGASGVIAASTASYSGGNDALALGIIDGIWPSSDLVPIYGKNKPIDYQTIAKPRCRLGDIMKYGLNRMDQWNTAYPQYNKIQHKLYHVIGDPSMVFYYKKPTRFVSTSVVRNNNSVIVSGIQNKNAIITFYNEATGTAISDSGKYDYNFSTPDSANITVCVTYTGMIPYINKADNFRD